MTAVKLQVAFLFKPWKHPAGFAPAFVFCASFCRIDKSGADSAVLPLIACIRIA